MSWGREHRNLEGIEAIGVDEIAWQRGHWYLTLAYQIDAGCRRLLRQVQHRGYGLIRSVRPRRYCASFVGCAGNERKREGYEPILSSTRWLFLKRLAHLTAKQASKLADLLRYNLKTVRSTLLKEEFQQFWHYKSWYWAGKFLDGWSPSLSRGGARRRCAQRLSR